MSTAAVTVFYNPFDRQRLKNNLRVVLEMCPIPIYLVEILFPGQKPSFPEALLTLRTDSLMWHQPTAAGLVEPLIPLEHDSLVLLDGDILIPDRDFGYKVSKSLEKYDVVQPFLNAKWLFKNARYRLSKASYGYAHVHGLTDPKTNTQYHPGYAWATRRDMWPVLPDRVVTGGDDALMCSLLANLETSLICEKSNQWIHDDPVLQKHKESTFGYLDTQLIHLFHGYDQGRQYTKRREDLRAFFDPDKHLERNPNGLYQWTSKGRFMESLIRSTWLKRREDS